MRQRFGAGYFMKALYPRDDLKSYWHSETFLANSEENYTKTPFI